MGILERSLCQQFSISRSEVGFRFKRAGEGGRCRFRDTRRSKGRSGWFATLLAGAKPADAVQRSLANLREVSAILAAKAPGDAPAFKAWLTGISRKVAEASSEGGLLGIGGVQVSDAEKATLGDIAKALGTSA